MEQRREQGERRVRYFARNGGRLLTDGEFRFYQALREAVGEDLSVLMKVRVGDVVTCSEGAWANGWGERLAKMHVDFVLVRPGSGVVVAAVELDDRSHRLLARRWRDRFLNRVFRNAGVALLRFRAVRHYDLEAMRDAVLMATRGAGIGNDALPAAFQAS